MIPSGLANPFTIIPAAYGQLFHTKWDHDIWTVPQKHAYNKTKYWPRGKMLGGCSAVNAMMFVSVPGVLIFASCQAEGELV
jgi:choline dehydrogenase